MSCRVLILNGHPDSNGTHFCDAIVEAYQSGAESAGHEIKIINTSNEDVPLLRSKSAFYEGPVPKAVAEAQSAISWASHLVIVYPLWLGTMPALLKGFLEQVFRPGFALSESNERWPKGRLRNKSARVIVTMGMPSLAYRFYYQAHGLKNLERNILKFSGIKPVRSTLFGMVEMERNNRHKSFLNKVRALGTQAG